MIVIIKYDTYVVHSYSIGINIWLYYIYFNKYMGNWKTWNARPTQINWNIIIFVNTIMYVFIFYLSTIFANII